MKIIMTLLIGLLSLQCLANEDLVGPAQFAGSWTGTGVYRLKEQQSFCRVFEMKFEGNKYLMTFGGGERVCDAHNEKFAPVSMAYQEGKLYYNGKVVGSITGNVLEARFSAPEGNGNIRNWRMSMRKEGNNMVYEESRTMNNDKTPLISFAGILSK